MDTHKEPHSVSLKVKSAAVCIFFAISSLYGSLTRYSLSRPSFSEQTRLPEQAEDTELSISPDATLDHNFPDTNQFIFNPVLTLPPSFGSAYVGETFSCTLCANNELLPGTDRNISAVQIKAEMQAPTQTIPLDLAVAEKGQETAGLKVGQSLQAIIHFDLKEEGNHVLAVSVSYTETEPEDDEGLKDQSRTFRKLYQFIAGPCLNVRSKVSDLSLRGPDNGKHPNAEPMFFALEAQLENMADGPVTLEKVSFSPKPSFTSASINWDVAWTDNGHMDCPFLMPRDMNQAAFLLKQQPQPKIEMTKDGRVILGQLTIQWRTSMGDAGFLTTGWLTSRKRQ